MKDKPDFVSTGIRELDKVFGGGLLRGSIVLVAGHPGVGKTTFAAQFVYTGLKNGARDIRKPCREERRVLRAHEKTRQAFPSLSLILGFTSCNLGSILL